MGKLASNILRFLIGATLFLAAVGKLLDNRAAAGLIGQWNLFPGWSLLILTLLLSLSELALSLWLFAGKGLRGASFTSAVFHGLYTTFTLIALSRGTRLPDCGCFGILYAHPLDWTMAWEDLGFSVLSVVLFLTSKKSRRDAYDLS